MYWSKIRAYKFNFQGVDIIQVKNCEFHLNWNVNLHFIQSLYEWLAGKNKIEREIIWNANGGIFSSRAGPIKLISALLWSAKAAFSWIHIWTLTFNDIKMVARCRTNMAFYNQLRFNKCSIFHTGMLKFQVLQVLQAGPGSSNQAYFNQSPLHWKSAPFWKGQREHTSNAEVGLSELRQIRPLFWIVFIRGHPILLKYSIVNNQDTNILCSIFNICTTFNISELRQIRPLFIRGQAISCAWNIQLSIIKIPCSICSIFNIF